MTGRGQANALTRATAILAALFFVTSLGLTIMASYGRAPRSILDGATAPAGQQAPGAPQGGNVLEQLQRMQGDQARPPGDRDPGSRPRPRLPRRRRCLSRSKADDQGRSFRPSLFVDGNLGADLAFANSAASLMDRGP